MGGEVFLATTGRGIARAEQGPDDAWSVRRMLTELDVRCLAADPLNPHIVFAGTQGDGLYRSADGGQTWARSGLDAQIVKSVACSAAQPGLVLAGLKPAMLFVSTDSGRTWTELPSFRALRRWWWAQPAEWPATTYVQAIAPSPSDSAVILVGIEACGIFRSADGGQSWQGHQRGSVRDCHSLTFHAVDGRWVYAAGGTGAGAAFSCDGGVTWSQPRDGLDRHYGWSCAADPARPEVWYASLSPYGRRFWNPPQAHVDGHSDAGIFRRMGDGPWRRVGGGLPDPLDNMPYALVTHSKAPRCLYAGLNNGEVWQTIDLGVSWRQLPFSLAAVHRAMIVIRES